MTDDMEWHQIKAMREERRAARVAEKHKRKDLARGGWFNWYVNRNRLSLTPSAKDLRMASHRRCL